MREPVGHREALGTTNRGWERQPALPRAVVSGGAKCGTRGGDRGGRGGGGGPVAAGFCSWGAACGGRGGGGGGRSGGRTRTRKDDAGYRVPAGAKRCPPADP